MIRKFAALLGLTGFILTALVGVAAAGGEMADSGISITESYQGGPLSAKVGETITLNLRNPASGGYTIVTPVYDEKVLKLVSREDIRPGKEPTPRAGDFGRMVFKFKAIAPGSTELVIRIARPWEKNNPQDFLKVKIEVAP